MRVGQERPDKTEARPDVIAQPSSRMLACDALAKNDLSHASEFLLVREARGAYFGPVH